MEDEESGPLFKQQTLLQLPSQNDSPEIETDIKPPVPLSALKPLNWEILDKKLYGRSREKNSLVKAYRRCTAAGKSHQELVLVSGPSGTGKTALARTMSSTVEEESDGFFISGKFDQLAKPESYYPLVQAIDDLVRQALQRGGATQQRLSEVVKKLNETDHILSDMIPSIKQLSGDSSSADINVPEDSSKGAHAEERVIFAFRQFMRGVCIPEEAPLILFLDDLQWAVSDSLNIIRALVKDESIKGLMVLGSCRGNEVAITDILSVMLRELEAEGTRVSNVVAKCVDQTVVNNMTSDVLNLPPEITLPLASCIHDETQGNFFFVRQFLQSLLEEGLLYKLNQQVDEEDRWGWASTSAIVDKLGGKGALGLLCAKIDRLDDQVKTVLKLASCFGAEFDDVMLNGSNEDDPSVVSDALKTLEAIQFVELGRNGSWRFTHDQIQQSSYSLIPESSRGAVHLAIGRKLYSALSKEQLEKNIFSVVNHYRIGAGDLVSQRERDHVSLLLLSAGEQAIKSSTFTTAASYLDLGIDLLGDDHWKEQYYLSLNLYNAAAEVEYCIANYERMKELLTETLDMARSQDDKTRALTSMMYLLGRTDLQQAITLGFDTLRDLGEPFPARCRSIPLLLEIRKTKAMINKLSDSEILGLPRMVDDSKITVTRIMILLSEYTLHGKPVFASLLSMRLVQSTIKDGLSGMSCVGFSALAIMMCTELNDRELGFRLARLSLKILEMFDAKQWLPRVYRSLYAYCFPFTNPVQESVKKLLIAHRVGLSCGDIEQAAYSAALYCGMGLHASLPLGAFVENARAFIDILISFKQEMFLHLMRMNYQVALNLRGECDNPGVLTGAGMVEEDAWAIALESNNVTNLCVICYWKAILNNIFGNFDKVESLVAQATVYHLANFPVWARAATWLHEGVAALAMCRVKHTRQRTQLAKRNLQNLRGLAKYSAHNFANKVAFLEAEFAVVHRNTNLAVAKYDESIQLSRGANQYDELALVLERASTFYDEIGQTERSKSCLAEAIKAYKDWGADGKVKQLLASEG